MIILVQYSGHNSTDFKEEPDRFNPWARPGRGITEIPPLKFKKFEIEKEGNISETKIIFKCCSI
jgi:hypothetical protein